MTPPFSYSSMPPMTLPRFERERIQDALCHRAEGIRDFSGVSNDIDQCRGKPVLNSASRRVGELHEVRQSLAALDLQLSKLVRGLCYGNRSLSHLRFERITLA